jgi:signal transduction histidine kinase
VHFGFPTILRALQIVPFVQAGALLLLVAAGFIVLRTRNRSTRERVWAGMARESAHQIGTPLSSMNGWLELLSEPADEARRQQALSHMRSDIERLERVAHRFERIGRPPRKEPVDMVGIARAVTDYFRARVPTLAKRVIIQFAAPDDPAMVQGDRVLLEWAVEAVVRNAIDALADREGTVRVTVENLAEQGVRVRVADSGPGVKRELRSRIFQPGFTTKEHGWGVGLSLSRRIVEENHGGSIAVVPDDSGAIFDIVLP